MIETNRSYLQVLIPTERLIKHGSFVSLLRTIEEQIVSVYSLSPSTRDSSERLTYIQTSVSQLSDE